LAPSGRSSTRLRRRMTAREPPSGESAAPKWRNPDRLLLRSRPWLRGQFRSSQPWITSTSNTQENGDRSGDLAHFRRARMPLAHVILVALQIGGAIVILVVKFKLDVLRLDVDVEHRRRSERGEGAERIPDIAAGLLADLDALFRRVRYLA